VEPQRERTYRLYVLSVRTLSSKLLYLRFAFARFIQGLQSVFLQLVVVVHVISYLGFFVRVVFV
jgi:hypothetical protein